MENISQPKKDNAFLKDEILKLKEQLDVHLVAHFYQKDEVFNLADDVGDSLYLAKVGANSKHKNVLFCGVGFMGQSVKILAPQKRVFMPKIACCSLARMIADEYLNKCLKDLKDIGLDEDKLLLVTYINSNISIKSIVGKMGGYACTSSNAYDIITHGLKTGKKIFFMPDRCLGQNFANKIGLKSSIIGQDSEDDIKNSDIICYDGFCAVHQLFTLDDIEFFRNKYPDILIITHPECTPEVVNASDFVGSTSMIIDYVNSLPKTQKVAIGTEYNMIKRLRKENTYVLSESKPQCPTMNETSIQDVYDVLIDIKNSKAGHKEIILDKNMIADAKKCLDKMVQFS